MQLHNSACGPSDPSCPTFMPLLSQPPSSQLLPSPKPFVNPFPILRLHLPCPRGRAAIFCLAPSVRPGRCPGLLCTSPCSRCYTRAPFPACPKSCTATLKPPHLFLAFSSSPSPNNSRGVPGVQSCLLRSQEESSTPAGPGPSLTHRSALAPTIWGVRTLTGSTEAHSICLHC